ncbi:MAG TPA: chorismate mutase [Solirubrobacteraceae bacterium]|nr:chorismate mutase [Solirubrobacteraceae bacterium]
MPRRLFALRGAIDVPDNDADAILDATSKLINEIVQRNALEPEDLLSCIFTVTEDLDAQFPAAAARQLGFTHVALLCAREIPVPGSMPRVIRLLLHYYADEHHRPQPVYLGKTGALRDDL